MRRLALSVLTVAPSPFALFVLLTFNFSTLKVELFEQSLWYWSACCTGQPVVIAGDFGGDPLDFPSFAKAISNGPSVNLERGLCAWWR